MQRHAFKNKFLLLHVIPDRLNQVKIGAVWAELLLLRLLVLLYTKNISLNDTVCLGLLLQNKVETNQNSSGWYCLIDKDLLKFLALRTVSEQFYFAKMQP